MKRICFISMGNIYTIPYLETYTKHISGPYSFIYWDREKKNEQDKRHRYYRFEKKLESSSIIEKAKGYIQYRAFVKKILLQEEFDLVVFLQTWSALLVGDVAKKYYKNKYIVDIRDYTYERCPIIAWRERDIIKNSCLSVISSEGYKSFLPKHEYKILHNLRELSCDEVCKIRERIREKDVLTISFIGYVNYQEQHKKLLLSLKNDARFRVNFVGTRALELKSFCDTNNISNVSLVDTFDAKDILKFYENTDFVNNLYGHHTPVLDYALSNKLYFAAELYMPILTCSNTFMSKISHKYGFGFDVDVEDKELGDKLWNYYNSINWDVLKSGCDAFMDKVRDEQEESHRILKEVLACEERE